MDLIIRNKPKCSSLNMACQTNWINDLRRWGLMTSCWVVQIILSFSYNLLYIGYVVGLVCVLANFVLWSAWKLDQCVMFIWICYSVLLGMQFWIHFVCTTTSAFIKCIFGANVTHKSFPKKGLLWGFFFTIRWMPQHLNHECLPFFFF